MEYNADQEFLLDLLYRSLDDNIEGVNAEILAKALGSQPWLRDELEQIKSIRSALSEITIPENEDFTKAVLNQTIAKVKVLTIFQSLWPLSAAAAVIAFVFALSFIYSTSDNFNTDAILGLDEMTIESAYVINN